MKPSRGTIVLVSLDPAVGHEQRGTRPCVVVSDPEVVSSQRFPMVCVLPLTTTPGEGALYPSLLPGASALKKTSYALIDQLRSISKTRIRSVFGRIRPDEQRAIDEGLFLFLGLERS